jgi:hypothetical protein
MASARRNDPIRRYHRVVRRDEIVEVVEVKPLTVADVQSEGGEEPVVPEPPVRPQPLRA